ncbi:hypothetical protein AB4589_15105 [Vibrio sp. 10N.222.49.A3]|uniref:hypothetical protein n=1 Tax=Vibrio sp. 10N.222.49.A3 TaxID=3229611 RepID=UPI003550DA4B
MAELTGKTIGIRLPPALDAKVLREADRTGQTKTEVIRAATVRQFDQEPIEVLIKQLELKLLRKTFEINCEIVGLTEDQKAEAVININLALGQEVLL